MFADRPHVSLNSHNIIARQSRAVAKSESKLRTQPVGNEGSQRARPVLPMAQPLKAEGEAKDLKAEEKPQSQLLWSQAVTWAIVPSQKLARQIPSSQTLALKLPSSQT